MGDLYHDGRVVGGNSSIDDSDVDLHKTWSSKKISEEIEDLTSRLDELDDLAPGISNVINDIDRSPAITINSSSCYIKSSLKIAIFTIIFNTTAASPTGGLCLGNFIDGYVPKGTRPIHPLIRDNDGAIEGSIYANNQIGVNTKLMVYGVTANHNYIAQFMCFIQ